MMNDFLTPFWLGIEDEDEEEVKIEKEASHTTYVVCVNINYPSMAEHII